MKEDQKEYTYTSTVEQIQELDSQIGQWTHHYASLREQLDVADREIMALHKKKWRLELTLVPVKTIPTFRPKKKIINPEVEVIDLDKLTPAQLAGLLAFVKAQQEDLEIEEEETEDDL